MPPRVIMIYIEPTPYIRGLVAACRAAYDGPVDVLYIAADLSQRWSLTLDPGYERILPASRAAALRDIWRMLGEDRGGRSVLHLAGWGHPLLLAAMAMARLRSVPVVVESDSWVGRDLGRTRRQLKRLVYPPMMSLAAHFLPGGTRQAAYLANFGVPASRITIVRMTVDVAAMRDYARQEGAAARARRRDELAIPAAAAVLLFVGRLEPVKGLDDLLAAFGEVQGRLGDARLVIVGEGTLRDEVEGASRANPAIIAAGRLAGEDLWATYCASDVLVLPSLFEPWGLVVNEAMAFGLPVVVSEEVGCGDDLVRDGQEGIVVRAGDRLQLAAALLALAGDDGGLRQRAAKAAHSRIAEWTLENEARTVAGTWRRWQPAG